MNFHSEKEEFECDACGKKVYDPYDCSDCVMAAESEEDAKEGKVIVLCKACFKLWAKERE
jgi:hypothetical protein